MTSMCGSGKNHAVMSAGGYYRPYTYQSDYYLPRSTWSRVSVAQKNTTWRFGSAMLIISAMLVLIAVLAIAGLALWMGAFRTDSKNAIVGFSCSFRIVRGERYNPMLKLNTSMVFREKERKFKNIFELLFRRSVLGLSYKQTIIDKFENGTLKVFFRLYLDRRKIPRSIVNVEDAIQDIIVKETYSISSLFKDMELDLPTILVKRINQEGIVNQKQGQQKHTMITKNGLLRPNRNSSLIMSSKPKTKPSRVDSNEPNIDFNNIPTIQGTYRATKVNITAENSTKGTSESIKDNKGLATTTRRAPSHTTTLQKISSHGDSSPTEEPSTFFMRSTTATFNRNKSDEKQESEMKTTSSGTTTVRSDLDIFKDFRNPDFENNSPWKPIVPGYVNTEFKLLPNDDVKETSYTESTTRRVVSTTNDSRDNVRTPNAGTSTISSTVPGLPLGSVNFRDVSAINAFDTDNTDFPRDRIVPGLTARPSDNGKLDIEVAGQLPSEMYSVKLKASSRNDDDRVTSSSEMTQVVSENIPAKGNAFQEKRGDSNATRNPEIKFDNSASTVEPDDIFGLRSDERIVNDSLTHTSGIGVAEPVSDTEVELEAKNRYGESGIPALTADENMLRNRKINVNPLQPIYTSYNTPDLNGGSLGSSLIENMATTKPFRHTIPVDKITSVVNYSINVPLHNLNTLSLSDNATTNAKLFQDKALTPIPSKTVEVETSVMGHDDAMAQLASYERVTSPDPNVVRIIKNDDRLSHFNVTESYSEPKLIAKDSGGKRGVSRNSTFVEIDIVKHTPGESEENSEAYADQVISGDSALQKKKVYNETLKAYVVENLVTLAPVKSNTGIGRPVRPRPKIDSPDTSLLEQLFGVRDYTHDRDTGTEPAVSESSSSSHEDENSTKSDEKESLNRKSTIVEQIVEVVTSISTRVSSSMKTDPVILKFIVTNSTTDPVTHSGNTSTSSDEATKSFDSAVDTTERILSWTQKRPILSAANLRTMQTSDRKMSLEENRVLLEKLKQLAQVKTDGDPVRIIKINSNSSEMLRPQDLASPVNIDQLKKIADVVTGNETLQNASSGSTLSRDGVEIFTKVLTKENRANETRTMSTIQKVSKTISKTNDSCDGFFCGDGKCLNSSAICNMLVECPSAEDEANCTCADFLKTKMLYQKICDGIADCWDYSDESNCDWCEKGQFVCGNSKSCIDVDKVCNGFSDCPGGEDEKKCTALIDDEPEEDIAKSRIDLASTENVSKNYSEIESHLEAIESSIIDTTTLYVLPDDLKSERLINDKNSFSPKLINQESTRNRDAEERKVGVAVSSKETPSNILSNGLIPGNNLRVKSNGTFPVANVYSKEIDNYNSRGYLSVRKNGIWGKLCLDDNLSEERHARRITWSLEDLAKAACKAITYQDYETVERVLDQNPMPKQFYYTLSYNDKSDLSDRTALSFKSSECPSGKVLKVKCKNFECGIRTQVASTARIVGGASSSMGNWPWQIALYKDGNYQCGGALINDRWVISAAHCFYRAQDSYWVARIGATRRGSFRSPHEQLLRVDYISLHPDYIDNGFVNDIAVIRLERAVSFSDYIRPVCLPKSPVSSETICVVTGWGQLNEIGRVFPDTLQEIQIPVISTEDCRRKTLFLPLYRITSGMLCAGLENGGKDACLGDSGGPLVCLSPVENRYVLQGITSNGYGCGRRERPGVYTKIYSYLTYIDYITTQKDIQPSVVEFCKGHRCPLGECLPKSRVCNGFLECSDGSDERDCSAISR
ncbi:PREDICTED: uncharacterized protein LOC105564821 [Vollenhovia emeryi]|uniref:uncharacterized protein LOC105564821 n=1 Tax=Vollenhovia emeryi TaxID=411798 RepID=UPI0005F49A5D|nr:PREDICTED: uncharacterized protein LOC105564821 [Vollenhovia emeryi]